MKCCYLVERLGPYHIARLNHVGMAGQDVVTVIELQPRASTYAWTGSVASEMRGFAVRSMTAGAKICAAELAAALEGAAPDVVFVNGWSDRGALLALAWCGRFQVPAVLLSDSQYRDSTRCFWREWPKGRVVRRCGAAFVAGERHAEYVNLLGMPRERIVTGYDVVDNSHFCVGAKLARFDPARARTSFGFPHDTECFLCVSRFVPKKNLPTLLRAYAEYRRRHNGADCWDLVLAGDGEEGPALRAQVDSDSRLQGRVHFPGFVQDDRLAILYGASGAFVLPSRAGEQWGLVVNEALAAGLPVLVSEACGCVPELVRDGVNGWIVDPNDVNALADGLERIARLPSAKRHAMAQAGQEIVSKWSLDRFAAGLRRAGEIARANLRPLAFLPTGGGGFDQALFRLLAARG